ncbi:hypothetical protein AOL_s00193g104 [Orbilia oligospora ATCC 24927]|uniref:Alpha-galactosidase n=1 Tax=Arthrobotrys oligospora (strain ATCC 24927 / CBS 115.81 / DSM 1491) TaxID=756982 RepID=G1XRA5_ARTOA|nr:hypothetical protein AOL_s00193g104 [Orbilia oligospora ATCC 24927]EGX44376.1 hypothetical protein AOL_s00193g104 [Orbilia oligospora ATCC 24927]
MRSTLLSPVLALLLSTPFTYSLQLESTTEGRLPAMGFNSWNCFNEHINEEKFLTAAQQLVDLGLKDLGYTYVNIDDGWSDKDLWRDPETKRIIVDTKKFPDGISGLADKVHELGLKLGIYSDRGTKTCASYPGSMDYEEIDAKTFADWGVDYLKYDNCFIPDEEEDEYPWAPEWWNTTHDGNKIHAPESYDFSTSRSAQRYRAMRDALKRQDRIIQFGMCNWGHAHVEKWGNETAQSWRIWGDILPQWTGHKDHIAWGVMPILNHALFHLSQTNFWGHADMDMLEVGNGLTPAEDRSHFALWAILKSPLLIGTPLDKVSPETLAVFKNKELIAFNQDESFGIPAWPYKWGVNADWTWNQTHPAEYYSGNSTAGLHVFMLNTLEKTVTKTAVFDEVPGLDSTKKYIVHDMWSGEDIGIYEKEFSIPVESHDIAALRFNEASEGAEEALKVQGKGKRTHHAGRATDEL